MRIDSAFDAGVQGMRAASDRLERAAQRTASPDGAGDVGAVVDRVIARHAFRASAAVVRTADELVGSLIDTVA